VFVPSIHQFGILCVIGLMSACGRVEGRIDRHIELAFHRSRRGFLCVAFCYRGSGCIPGLYGALLARIDRLSHGFSFPAGSGRFMGSYGEGFNCTVPTGLEIPPFRVTGFGQRDRI
jgi:hypothetical protein